jgi:hypothetical protein
MQSLRDIKSFFIHVEREKEDLARAELVEFGMAAVPSLIKALDPNELDVRYHSLNVLGLIWLRICGNIAMPGSRRDREKMRTFAMSVSPTLTRLIRSHPSRGVGDETALLLSGIEYESYVVGDMGATQAIISALQDDSPNAEQTICGILAGLGSVPPHNDRVRQQLARQLITLLNHPSAEVQTSAHKTLQHFAENFKDPSVDSAIEEFGRRNTSSGKPKNSRAWWRER